VLAWIPMHTVGTLLAALTAANWAATLVFGWAAYRLLRRHHIRLEIGDERIWGKVLGFSVPATLAAFASWPQFWAITTILKMRSTFGAVGLFSVALQLPRNVIVFSQALSAPYVPMISRLHAGGSYGHVVKRVQRGIATIVFLPSFLFALLSMLLLRLLYGREFQSAWDVVIVLSAAWYLKSLNDAVTNFLLGSGRLWWSLAFNLAALAALLGSGWILTGPYAAFGAGVAFLLTYATYYVVSSLSLRKELKLPWLELAELAGVPLLFFGLCFWVAPRLATPTGILAGTLLTIAACCWIARVLTDPTAAEFDEVHSRPPTTPAPTPHGDG
jgi:O-antigen/teichoic acid export membrane protein